LNNSSDWAAYCKSGKKPEQIPSNPNVVYRSEFKTMGDWLGTGYVASYKRKYLPFSEAREFVRKLGLKSHDQWRSYSKSGNKPDDIPSVPNHVYKSEYESLSDWLGIVSKWTKAALLSLLKDLRPKLGQLEERELYVILQQGGTFPALRVAFGGASPMHVLRDLKSNGGRGLEQAIKFGYCWSDGRIYPLSHTS
jgi:hypothetical protein